MSDIETVARAYEAFAAHDLELLMSLADAGCVITQDPALPWGGRYVGHEGVTAFAFALLGAVDSTVTTETLFEADGQVIQVGRTRGSVHGSGTPFDVAEVWPVP